MERLRERSEEVYKTARAINRVIEEGIMGLAAVRYSETEDVDITCDRDNWSDEATVTVRLNSGANDEVETVRWHSDGSGPLTDDEEQRARDAARRKAAES